MARAAASAGFTGFSYGNLPSRPSTGLCPTEGVEHVLYMSDISARLALLIPAPSAP